MKEKLKQVWTWLKSDRKRIIAGIVILLVLVVGSIWLIARGGGKTQYQTATVQKGTIVATVSASGKALTTGILNINTQASGVVKEVLVKDGSKVYAGQKIAQITLDSAGQLAYSQALSSFLSAQNSVANAKTSYYTLQAASFAANQKFINDAAARSLTTDDPTYIQEYDAWKAAEANFLQYDNNLRQANNSLNSASISLAQNSPTITAPFTGVISNISLVSGMVLAGSSSSTTTRVATIENTSTPIVQVTLSEIDVPKVKVGQKVTVTFDSISGKTFTGIVATVDRIGTVTSNVVSYLSNIKLDISSSDILPNMAATGEIIIDSKSNVLSVPSSAVHSQNGTYTVQILKNGTVQTNTVEVGIASSSETEIISGLSEGETVVTGTVAVTTNSSSSTRSVFSSGIGGGAGAALRGR